jgi:ParB-like chromosome segregation protein Spo0J
MNYTINPEYEKLMPKLSAEEYEALKQSIKEDGQFYPIIVNGEGVILDGHHRYRACNELGIEPKFSTTLFKDKLLEKKFVIEANLKRRQLNDFQRAEFGMALLQIESELAKQRQGLEGTKKGQTLESIDSNVQGKASTVVSKTIGLSEKTFERAKTILLDAPESTKEQLRKGELSISGVYDNIQLTKAVPTIVKAKVEDKIEEIKTAMRAENVDKQAEKEQVISKLTETAKQGNITSLDIKKAVATTRVETLTKGLSADVQAKTLERTLQQIDNQEEQKVQVMDIVKEVEEEEKQTLDIKSGDDPLTKALTALKGVEFEDKKVHIDPEALITQIDNLVQKYNLCCPNCGEHKLQWACGHTLRGR